MNKRTVKKYEKQKSKSYSYIILFHKPSSLSYSTCQKFLVLLHKPVPFIYFAEKIWPYPLPYIAEMFYENLLTS